MQRQKLLHKINFPLLILVLAGFLLRLNGINWDLGHHLHPDERMLIMVTLGIKFFNQLNPHFFNYGSLPIYVLGGLAQLSDLILHSQLNSYDGLLLVGRSLAIAFDLLTLIMVYKTANLLFNNRAIAFFSGFFYLIAFFPIQNSHFFTVDIFLNFQICLLVYILLIIVKQSPMKKSSVVTLSLVFASTLATKITALIFYPLIIFEILINLSRHQFFLRFRQVLINVLIFHFSLLVFHFLFMPYAYLDFQKFIEATLNQTKMNNNAYVFPYTLQYVSTIPYLYYLKNIFFWGLGPVISILSTAGLLVASINPIRSIVFNKKSKIKIQNSKLPLMLYVACYAFYFLIIGRSAVKFMRYMLPVYPFLAIMAGHGFTKLLETNKFFSKKYRWLIPGLAAIILLFALGWTFSFVSIYFQTHTRIEATNWINSNIPTGSTLAIEHWDDRLPLYEGNKYRFVEMTLYDLPDDEFKWKTLNEKLKQTDYIILASNRLYTPLSKLTNCQKFKICYPLTAQYYKQLFAGKLGFKKIAEFSVYPKLVIACPVCNGGNWKLEIRDDDADESFTVYDHPKILIFKKTI